MALKDIDKESLDDVDVLLSTIGHLFADTIESSSSGIDVELPKKDRERLSTDRLIADGFEEPQIEEIEEGYDLGIDPTVYMEKEFNWKQMREIRMGLVEGIDISKYCNLLYTAGQMKEIRLGLENGIDVSSYAKLLYSTTDMRKARLRISSKAYKSSPQGYEKTLEDVDTGLTVIISADCMSAYIQVPEESAGKSYTKRQILDLLGLYGVIYGCVESGVTKVVKGKTKGNKVLVASGIEPVKGADGYYEMFFDNTSDNNPVELEDGRVDYTSRILENAVHKGEVLVTYHHGTAGTPGRTVTDVSVEASAGAECKRLSGHGIQYDEATDSYLATEEGFVFYDADNAVLNVWKDYVINGDVNCYNGNIDVDGRLTINGSVGDDAVISAKGDIIVDGFVAGATLRSGQNIMIRSGVNANGKGSITAEGTVKGNFFENAVISAKGNVESNYFLNCEIETDGRIIAKGNKSRIMGGNVRASIGIESAYIGGYGSSHIYLDVGNMKWINERMEKYQKLQSHIEEELSQLIIGKYKIESRFLVDELEKNSIYQKTLQAIDIKSEQKTYTSNEINRLRTVAKAAEKAYINVKIEMQQESRVILGGKPRKFRGDVKRMIITTKNR